MNSDSYTLEKRRVFLKEARLLRVGLVITLTRYEVLLDRRLVGNINRQILDFYKESAIGTLLSVSYKLNSPGPEFNIQYSKRVPMGILLEAEVEHFIALQ